ncbi:MAG: T9SS type A sorting domain-containing protein [Candidatus Latescibacteria bacterium]|nr:T9SS type A sorting domain-containing protein [Candidatus Latescibacterota bacterium]NIO57297.1 T9SS type A sorting domain-containing protein [Candidatus Latescibacterota bacterium]
MKRCRVGLSFCLLLLSLTLQSAAASSDWKWQYPLPQGNGMCDVQFVNSSTALAVGNSSTVMRTTDSGTTWLVIANAGDLTHSLMAISMIGELTGTAVGCNGTILRTTDGGTSWSVQTSGTSEDLFDVHFTDVNTGYAVGRHGTILATTDGGVTWIPQSSGTGAALLGVSFVHPDTGTVVGEFGTILRTTNGGASWGAQASSTTNLLYAVHFTSVNYGVAVGRGQTILETNNGGATWMDMPPPSWPGNSVALRDVQIFGSIIYIIGNYSDTVSDFTYFLLTSNGGSSWATSSQPNDMVSLAMHGMHGLAVGEMGIIHKTSDGGYSWPKIFGPSKEANMQAIDLWGIYDCIVLATPYSSNSSYFLRTSDGGDTWIDSGVSYFLLYDVTYADQATIYAVGRGHYLMDMGAAVLRSDNGGADWGPIWWSSIGFPPSPMYVDYLNSVSFGDSAGGVAVGEKGWIVTIRNGTVSQKDRITTQTLNGVSMPDDSTVYAVGGGGTILRSNDGGDTWVQLVSGTGSSLRAVHFIDADHGTAVGNGGTILHTSNGGATWTPQVSGTTESLYGVSFSSPSVGFVVGGAGTILKTIDGGVNWTPEISPTAGLADVFTINRNNVTIVGGEWNILAKRDETLPAFYAALTAVLLDNAVRLEWSIGGADNRIRGFHVYRRAGGPGEYIRLNQQLILKEIHTFTDWTVKPGFEYEFVLGVVRGDGSEVRSNVAAVELPPATLELFQNYPNPFNPVTSIRFSLPEAQKVTLKVYDITGRHVITLVDGINSRGLQTIKWDAKNSAGQPVSSGIYYYQLQAGKQRLARKMVLIR